MIGEFIDQENLVASRSAIKEIFFLSSRSGAKLSGSEKEIFFQTWAGYYLDILPAQTLVFKTNLGKIVGYLTGCYDCVAALDLYNNLFYYVDALYCCYYNNLSTKCYKISSFKKSPFGH